MNKLKTGVARIPGIFWGILAAGLFFALTADNFLHPKNLEQVLNSTAILLVISIGSTMAILAAKIDLSVGGIATFAGMVAAVYLHSVDDPGIPQVLVAIVISVAVGTAMGAFNGYMIGYRKFDNWLITFSTMSIGFGLSQVITGGNIISGYNKTVRFLGDGEIFGVKVLLFVTLILTALMIFVIRNTRFGMHIYAVGDSEVCAAVSGVNVAKTNFLIYLISGAFAGFCGFLLLSKTNSMGPTTADGYEFNAIAAVIVGGTTFDGGKGGLGGTVLGALFIAIVKNGLQHIGLSIYWQQAFVGIFILCIILIDVINERRKAKRAQRRLYLQ